jgi:transposase
MTLPRPTVSSPSEFHAALSPSASAELARDDHAEAVASGSPVSILEWCVIACAGVKVFAGVVALAFGFAPVTSLPVGLVVLQIFVYGGAGAVLVVAHARDHRTAYLGGFLLLVASAFAGAPVASLARAFPRMEWLTAIYPDACLPLFLSRFIAAFPRRPPESWQARTLRQIAGASLVLGLALLIATAIGGWGFASPHGWVSVLQRRSAGGTLYWTVVFVLILSSLIVAFTGTPAVAQDEARRVRWFWISVGVGFGPATLAILAGAIPGIGPPFTSWMMRGSLAPALELLLATVPITVAYAVMVRRMLPLRIVVRQAIQYLFARWTISAAVVLPLLWLAVEGYVHRNETVAAVFSTRARPVLGTTLVASLMFLLRDDILRAIDRWFFRESYDPEQLVIDLGAKVRRARGIDELVAIVTSGVDRALRPEALAMLVANQSGDFVSVFGAVEPLPAGSVLVDVLLRASEPLDVVLESGGPLRWLPRLERQWLVDSRSRCLVPLRSAEGHLVGLLTVAERRSELPFSLRDRQILLAIADMAASTIEARTARREMPPGEVAENDEWQVTSSTRWSEAGECPACGHIETGGARPCARCGTALSPSAVPQVMFGKFRFDARVGRGGMGVVYRATDLTLDRVVAIKTLPGTSPEASQRLRAEAKAMAAVVHPHLALIYDAESWRGRPMLICEYMVGGTLADRLIQGPVDVREALALGKALAEALAAVHGKGLLHRDIKPSNIGFADDGLPKLLDFGLVHIVAREALGRGDGTLPRSEAVSPSTLSVTESLVGTPLYLSPEAIAGHSPSVAFDLWSLHVSLYEAIAGRHPFQAGTSAGAFERIRVGFRPESAANAVVVPAPVGDYFTRALASDPTTRFHTALDVAKRLGELSTGA